MYGIYRTTQRTLADQVTRGLQANLDKLGTLQSQISSGKRISKPSDDPAGADAAMLLRSQTTAATQAGRNASDGLAWLGSIDTTLNGINGSLQRARDLTVQGASTGSNDATSLASIATEIDQIRSGVIDEANTTYLGRPVLGGTTAGGKAYDSTGTFVGDGNPVNRTVGPGVSVQVNVSGPQALGSGPTGVLDILATISADLKSNPAALGGDLTNLDAAMKNLASTQAVVGARFSRVQSMKTDADNSVLALKAQLSTVEDVDLPKAVVDLQLQQNAYQAALGASSKVLSTSLMDFLK
jgi:flagellar hook-associated protein 3 FlgL